MYYIFEVSCIEKGIFVDRRCDQRRFSLVGAARAGSKRGVAPFTDCQLLVAAASGCGLFYSVLCPNVALGLYVTAVKTYSPRPSISGCGHWVHGQQHLSISGW